MPRYIDAELLEKKLFPLGMIADGQYAINAKAVKVAIDSIPTADVERVMTECTWCKDEFCTNPDCPVRADYCPVPNDEGVCRFEERITEQKTTCLNCKHFMFSDMYGECNKQLRIVNPSDTCEYAEPKKRGGEK